MKKILLIDDEDALRSNLSRILRLEGFEAFAASGGQEGIEWARRLAPDLILCDIKMPGMDGFQALETLRQDSATARIPFIFLTAKNEISDMRAGMNLGADDYLIKPVRVDDLLAAIAARLERAQQFVGADVDFSSAKPIEALGLSAREADILALVAQGKVNKEIGDACQISTATVRKHLENIYRKLRVSSRNAAALRAIEALPRR